MGPSEVPLSLAFSLARACSCSSALPLLSARLPCTTLSHIKNRHVIGIVWQEHAPLLLQLRPSAALSQATLHHIITHQEQAYYRHSVARVCSCSSALLLLSARLPCTILSHIKNRHIIGIVWQERAPAAPPFCCSQPGYPAPHLDTSRRGILQAQCGKSMLLQLRPSVALRPATLHHIYTHQE